MKIYNVIIVCISLGLGGNLNAQYNENAGKNKAYEEVEVDVPMLDSDGEALKDEDGNALFKSEIQRREVKSDVHGNANGNGYDLAQDGAFEGNTIAVLNFCGNTMQYAKAAVAEKGIAMVEWRLAVPPVKELKEKLEMASQLWVLSGYNQFLTEEHLNVIEEFFNSGKGLYIWGDNEPLYHDANFITERLFGTSMSGDSPGNQIVGISGEAENRAGIVDGHLISTGVAHIYEGVTIATVAPTQELSPLIYGSNGELVAAVYEKDGKRAIIDGGFTRLCVSWDNAGTARYIKNAAAWLVNYERFGEEVYSNSGEGNSDQNNGDEDQGGLIENGKMEEVIQMKSFFGNEQISITNYQ